MEERIKEINSQIYTLECEKRDIIAVEKKKLIDYAKTIAEQRTKYGLSLSGLANKIGVARQTCFKWESLINPLPEFRKEQLKSIFKKLETETNK